MTFPSCLKASSTVPFFAFNMLGARAQMKTYMANSQAVDAKWLLIDAKGKTLGRLASAIARRLRGKHRPQFTPHADTGDFIVVINADQLHLTGKKQQDKIYHHHTGYPGGIKSINYKDLQAKHPGRVLELAVRGMLPKGPLGYKVIKKLKVYAGDKHPHTAQQPELVELEEVK